VQAGGRDPSGRARDRPDRSQHPAGDEPADEQGERCHDGQRDSRVDQQLMRVGSALCGFDGPCLGDLMDGLCQLMLDLCQLILVACQLALVLRQPRHREAQRLQTLQLQILCQLMLVLCQLKLVLSQLRQSLGQRRRRRRQLLLEIPNRGRVGDLR
jgi:hypothetical protein